MKIGILGQGYVGSAIKIGFEKHYKDINTFDKYSKSKSTVSNLEELTKSSEIMIEVKSSSLKTLSNTSSFGTIIIASVERFSEWRR